ncbi:MAG: hypothetical protein KatS3mg026_1296 [Bacteroidia bacterium]|nr:MAG: hypothetical protein KatS3mg026_1296 [Bacteroidia bacterium]
MPGALKGLAFLGLGLAQGFTGAGSLNPSNSLKTTVRGDLPRSEAGQNLEKGRDLALAGECTKALPFLERTKNQDPTLAEAWFWLGYCKENTGHYEEALRAYQEAYRLKPQLTEALFGIGSIYLRTQRYAEAAEAFQKVAAEKPTLAEAHFYLAAAQLMQEKRHEALPALKKALEQGLADSVQALLWLGDTYFELDSFPQAAEAYERAARAPSAPGEAFLGLGKARLGMNDPQAALPPLQQAVQRLPSSPYTHYYLGLAYRMQGKEEEALASFDKAIELKPDHARSHYEAGRLRALKGDKAGAQKHYEALKNMGSRLAQPLLSLLVEEKR